MDVSVGLTCGTLEVLVTTEGTDALAVPDILHHLGDYLERLTQIPACLQAMTHTGDAGTTDADTEG